MLIEKDADLLVTTQQSNKEWPPPRFTAVPPLSLLSQVPGVPHVGVTSPSFTGTSCPFLAGLVLSPRCGCHLYRHVRDVCQDAGSVPCWTLHLHRAHWSASSTSSWMLHLQGACWNAGSAPPSHWALCPCRANQVLPTLSTLATLPLLDLPDAGYAPSTPVGTRPVISLPRR